MPDFSKQKDVERWLKDKPREVAIVIAARAALRCVPALLPKTALSGESVSDFGRWTAISAFRAVAVPWVAGRYPSRRSGIQQAAFLAASSANFIESFANSPFAAAADTAAFVSDQVAADDAAVVIARSETREALRGVAADAAMIEQAVGPADLATRPIWQHAAPDWAEVSWGRLKRVLLERDENWDVWTDWYEARRDGRPTNEALEVARVLIPSEIWIKGAGAVNYEIRRLIEEHSKTMPEGSWNETKWGESRWGGESPSAPTQGPSTIKAPAPIEAIPRPDPVALQFDDQVDRPIDLNSSAVPGEQLADGAGRREDYAELRLKAFELQALGINRLGHLWGAVDRFIRLPEQLVEVRAKLFWSRLNTLRIKLAAHAQAAAARSGEADDRVLEASVASLLKDIVETANIFVLGDPFLMELDAARPGPQEVAAAQEEAAALAPALNEATINPDVATDVAREALKEQIENVNAAGENLPDRQAADFGRRSIRNFVGAVLRSAYRAVQSLKPQPGEAAKGIREGYFRGLGNIGAAATVGLPGAAVGAAYYYGGAFIEFVARNAEALIAYVTKAFQNPVLIDIINWIARHVFW